MRILSILAALVGILGVAVLVRANNDLPACVNDECDCEDFQNWQEAQTVLDAFVGDPFLLDRDKDGLACESLAGAPAGAIPEYSTPTLTPTSPSYPSGSGSQPPANSNRPSPAIPALWEILALLLRWANC
jgi:Excalibur calcium-binding domain